MREISVERKWFLLGSWGVGYLEIWFFNPLRFARPPIFSLRSKQGDRIVLVLILCVVVIPLAFCRPILSPCCASR